MHLESYYLLNDTPRWNFWFKTNGNIKGSLLNIDFVGDQSNMTKRGEHSLKVELITEWNRKIIYTMEFKLTANCQSQFVINSRILWWYLSGGVKIWKTHLLYLKNLNPTPFSRLKMLKNNLCTFFLIDVFKITWSYLCLQG